jgi:hypothetical protein
MNIPRFEMRENRTTKHLFSGGAGSMVSRFPREMVKSSDFEIIRKIKNEFKNAWEANVWEQDSLIQAWKFFFGAEGEQWDQKAKLYKEEHRQRMAQYNMIRQKVATFSGMLIADEYDFKYTPKNGVKTTGIEALENAYYCDKETCDYDYHYGLAIEDGVIHLGILEVVIVKEFDYRGNIAFKRALPGRWVVDPYWKTDDDRDCMKAWKQGHMTIKQLEETFKKLPNSPEFDAEKQRLEKIGMDYTRKEIYGYDIPFPNFKNTYQVIESHWVEKVHTEKIIAKNVDGQWVAFPVTEDNERLQAFAEENCVLDWQDAHTVPYVDKIHHSAIICPELWPYQLLDTGKPEVQIKGLPIIQFTTKRDIAGRNQGKVRDMIDPQKDMNYSKSKRWELIANQLGGGLVYDKRKFPNEKDQEDFEKHHNDVSRAWGVNGNPNELSTHIRDPQVNPEYQRQGEEAFEILDRITGVSAAADARGQGAGEPASLFAMKLKVNKMGTLTIDRRVKRFVYRMAEAYFNQANITYAGAERKFTSNDGKKESILNEDIGGGYTKNKVEDIPRVSVSISESPNNLTKQMRDRAEVSAVVEGMPPEYREPLAIAYGALFETTSLNDEKKQAIGDALKLEEISARLAKMAEMSNTIASGKQGELMTIQLTEQIKKIESMINEQMPKETPEMISEPGPEPQNMETPQNIEAPPEDSQMAQPAQEEIPNLQEPL